MTSKHSLTMTSKHSIDYTGFWTFFCNPAIWQIDEFLEKTKEGEISQYSITEWQKDYFKIGQLGIIRVGNDNRTIKQLKGRKKLERGIYAIVEIVTDPYKIKNNNDGHWMNLSKKNSEKYVVGIKYIRNYINSPVLLKEIENDYIIKEDGYLLSGHQATTMPLNEDAFNRVLLYGEEARVKMTEFASVEYY